MSANTDSGRSITALRQMDEPEARRTLTMAEYERWESVNKHLDEAEEVRKEWAENEREATDILSRADPTWLASDIEMWGNELSVYYGPEDERLREAIDGLGDAVGVDLEAVDDMADEELPDADDVDDEAIEDVKAALAELIGVAIIELNGTRWADLDADARADILESIAEPRPDGWGLAGLMDAWTEIQVTVEENRDDRLERVKKFRQAERRGDR